MQQFPLIDVYLNIYNYCQCNTIFDPLGIGAYHTGIQIKCSNIEYQFTVLSENEHQCGIWPICPGMGGFPFCRKVHIATVPVSLQQFDAIFKQLQAKYTVGRYHLFHNNCNHFVREFVLLLTGIELPNYLFRLTNFLDLFSCCLPQRFLNGQQIWDDYNRERIQKAQEFLPLRDRIKIDLRLPISPQAMQLFLQKEAQFS